MSKDELKLELELFGDLSKPESKFKEYFIKKFSENLFGVSTILELTADYKKYKRMINGNGNLQRK